MAFRSLSAQQVVGLVMHEGMFSLMQMAKTCGALAYHGRKKLPFISVLIDPTMAGVMASFASVGDLISGRAGCAYWLCRASCDQGHHQGGVATGFSNS